MVEIRNPYTPHPAMPFKLNKKKNYTRYKQVDSFSPKSHLTINLSYLISLHHLLLPLPPPPPLSPLRVVPKRLKC